MLKSRIADGVDLNAREETRGLTALHIAAAGGYCESVKLLLSSGARRDIASDEGMVPLHMAGSSGSAAVMELLLADRRALATLDWRDKGRHCALARHAPNHLNNGAPIGGAGGVHATASRVVFWQSCRCRRAPQGGRGHRRGGRKRLSAVERCARRPPPAAEDEQWVAGAARRQGIVVVVGLWQLFRAPPRLRLEPPCILHADVRVVRVAFGVYSVECAPRHSFVCAGRRLGLPGLWSVRAA